MKEGNMNPRTSAEWAEYVNSLTPDQLWSKAQAMNTVTFVRTLLSEGYEPTEVTDVFRIFAQAFEDRDIEPPGKGSGNYLNFNDLLIPVEAQFPG